MKEMRNFMIVDVKHFDEILKVLERHYVVVNTTFDRTMQIYLIEIVCRRSEWNLIKKELPLRKEGSVYSV